MSEIHLSCDTVVIGAGSAGIEAYKSATQRGVKCILVESGPLGTSAKRTGDTPMSTLMAAGRLTHSVNELHKFGIKANFDFAIDTDRVLNDLRKVRSKETGEVLSFIYQIPEHNRLIGKARFLDEHNIMVNDTHIVTFKTVVVATGSVPIVPYELSRYGVEGGVYTVNDLFDLDHLPNSIAIFGSNREGIQIGQALSYLGIKVVVFGSNNLWDLTDDAVIDTATDAFKERFDIVISSYITAFEKYEHGFGIYYLDANNFENLLNVESVLSANVRFPKLEGLNLRELGVKLNRQGCIVVDEKTMQTSVDHIFAAGDVTSVSMTTSKAKHTGSVAGSNAADFPNLTKKDPILNVNVLYSDPELAIVGMSYSEVKQRAKEGKPFVSSEVRTNDGHFRATHKTGGILRIYCDEESHKLLGAELCLYRGGSIAHFIAMAIQQGLTVENIANMTYFSPSYEEVVQKACIIAQKNLERKSQGLR